MTLVPLAASLATAGLMAFAIPAGAVTNACASGDGGFCGGQSTVQAAPAALAVGAPAAQVKAGTPLVAVTPAVSLRQDFDQRNPVNPVNNDKIFKWAPRGVLSNLCVTETGGTKSQLTLQRCVGSQNQRWTPAAQASGFNWVNDATGLAMTNASGMVQARSVGTGTALNKRWTFTS